MTRTDASSQLSNLELSFLCACQEMVLRQQDILPALGQALGVPPEEIYYTWWERRKEIRSAVIPNTDWRYLFHGTASCDLTNLADGRFVRVDFGPHGRLDTFSGWGVLQFVMASKSPWPEFINLKVYLAEKPPPYNRFSGSHVKMVDLTKQWRELGVVEAADPELCEFVQQHQGMDFHKRYHFARGWIQRYAV